MGLALVMAMMAEQMYWETESFGGCEASIRHRAEDSSGKEERHAKPQLTGMKMVAKRHVLAEAG